MNAYDKGSDARNGPARRLPAPRSPQPGPESPAGGPAPGTRPPGPGRPVDRPPPPHRPDDGSGTGPAPENTPAGLRTGVAALSLRYRIGAAAALAVVAAGVCAHLGMVFLHLAPSNTVSKQHHETISDWIYPEFEQNWKLFAPNPLQQNITVQVRAEMYTADGASRTTGWYNLSSQDGRAIDGSLVPSHTQQNLLRRAWGFFASAHDDDNRPVGLRGTLSEAYLRRIAVMRLHRADAAGPGGVVARVQIRSRTAHVPPPDWSEEKISTEPVYRTLPWWSVPDDEARGGIG